VTVAEAYQAVHSTAKPCCSIPAVQPSSTQLHITGAINIPINEIETRLGELDPDTWYITYCT
jgi:rhodanese-related sulfurtransferase